MEQITGCYFHRTALRGIRFYLDSLVAFGKRGLACQPCIIGIGLGGSKDACMVLGKRAACLRIVEIKTQIPRWQIRTRVSRNSEIRLDMGAMGFVGKSMVIDCNIEVGFCHTGGMQMSVHAFCLSSRRAVARIFPSGEVVYRTDLSGILLTRNCGLAGEPRMAKPRRLTLSTNPKKRSCLHRLRLGTSYLHGWNNIYSPGRRLQTSVGGQSKFAC